MTDVAHAFAEMVAVGRRMAARNKWLDANPRLRDMPIDDLKRLWDAYDGVNSPLGFDGEAIHMALNFRGEGHYCAV